ncbi:hypothetical protein JCM9279_000261 [Rhodotorula babjevae]
MPPPPGLSSPLSSLSPLSSRSPRSPSPAARSPPPHTDDIAEHSPNAPLDSPTSTKQHSPPATYPARAELEAARGQLVESVKAGDEREDEDVNMSQGDVEDMDMALSRSDTGENGGERASSELVKELEDDVKVEVDNVEEFSPSSARRVVATPSPADEPPRPPPLTPRSQRTFDNFKILNVARPSPFPPPPGLVLYQYLVALPFPNSGGHLVGRGGHVAHDLRVRSGLAHFQVLEREDKLAYIVMTGSRRAIRRALDIIKEIENSEVTHSQRGAWHRAQLQNAGSSWCEFDEANLEIVEGYWLLERFSDVAVDANMHLGPGHPGPVPKRQWGGAQMAGGQFAATVGRYDWRAQQQQPQPVPGHDRRVPPPRWPALHGGVDSGAPPAHEHYDDRSRAKPSRDLARRRSSRSASPSRRPERSGRSPSRSLGDRHSASVPQPEPRWAHRPRGSTSGRSHHRHEPSTAELDAVKETKPPSSSLAIPISISAIERFIGPNAAGHFITQTTGVELKVDAGLEGATLRLELGAGATSDSLVEARALVDKVLERSGLAAPPLPPPGTARSDAPSSSRGEPQQRDERESGAYERGGGRERRGRSREGPRRRDEERCDEGRSGRGGGRSEVTGTRREKDSRRRDERSYSPERRRHHSPGSTRRSHHARDDDRTGRARPPSPSPSPRSVSQHYPRRASTTRSPHQPDYSNSYGASHTPYSSSRNDQNGASSTARQPQPAVREWDLLAERDRAGRARESGFARSGWERRA